MSYGTNLTEDDVRTFSLVDIFEGLSRREIEQINWRRLSTRVRAGEVFFTPMDLTETLFVLRSGRVRIYKKSPTGRQLTLAVLQSGTVFGEMALLGQYLRNSYAEGFEDSEIAAMCRADVERLILEKPRVGLKLVQLLSERLAGYEQKLEDIGLKEVPARLASLILSLVEAQGVRLADGYKITTRYTHWQLGTMIGANREATTRAFRRLKDAGLVRTERRYIYARDLDALKEAADDDFYRREE